MSAYGESPATETADLFEPLLSRSRWWTIYLGLYDTLRELIVKAGDHIDGNVRGVVDAYPDF